MVERSVVASFTGQLFEAAATTKKWTSISSASASIQIVNVDEEAHQIVGLDEDCEIFVHTIDKDIQLRSKDNFVQWKKKDSSGKLTTYGARLKDSRESERLEGIVGGIIAMLETIPSPAPWPTDSKPQANEKPTRMDHEKDMLLKIHLPGKQTTVITVPPSITMEELLSLIVMKRRLDPRYYELVLPPSKPRSMQAQLVPTTPLHTLNITEIHVVKRSKPLSNKKHHASSPPDKTKQPALPKQRSMTLPSNKKNAPPSSAQTQTPPINQKQTPQPSLQKQLPMAIVTVHLPYDQRTVIQVSPAMTMPQLLVYICEKRNLNPAHHTLVLPSPTSGQVRMATREMTVSSLRSSVITLVDLKAPSSGKSNSMIPDYDVSGKKGSFSPTKVKPAAVETSKKRTAPQIPANEVKRTTTQNAMHSAEATVGEKSDKEQPLPIKHIAKRKAPPPPKGAKKDTTVSLSQREPGTNGNLVTAHAKAPLPPGSPGKRPAPAIPTAAKQPTAGKQILKQTSDSALTTHQPPASPLKRLLPSTTEDVTDHPVVIPPVSAAKKRRPAPARPAPTPPNPHVQHKLESPEFEHDDVMDTSIPDHMTAQLQQRANRPGSATSAQIKLEINELEACLADVVEEAEWHLQQEETSTKQDHLVDETDSTNTPMEVNVSQSSAQADNKTVPQSQGLAPDQMVSESGTVRGIKGRVKEQIASNQSKIMIEGLVIKKQQPFARTPLSVVHKADSLDGAEASDRRTSLKRYGSQEAISTKENEDVMKRSNSLRSNQVAKQTDGKQKPRGKAPPPPQDKVKAKQPQQIQSKPLDHQSTAAPEGHNVIIPAENNEILQQNTETLTDKTITSTPDTAKKVPPKVKPKTARAKSKEAEDNSMVMPEAPSPVVVHGQSQPHPSLSKRAKSESYIKRIPQASPKTDKKPSAIIESSNDGQQVLVLSPAGSKNANKDTSVRIFLPPPPPILPPSQEQESENSSKNGIDNKIPIDTAPVSTNNTSESTVTSKLHSNVVTSDITLQQQIYLSSNDDQEVDSEMEAIKPLPHILFQSREDLPSTPPGSPCNELEVAEMKMVESDDDIVPLPPPLDDFDGVDGMIPPPDDFDPLSLPPPLLGDDQDDAFDIIPPPPSLSVGDDIIATTAAPPSLSTGDNNDASTTAPPLLSTSDNAMTAPPPPSLSFFDDDINIVTTETSSQPFEDDETFKDLPMDLFTPLDTDEATALPEGGQDTDEILLNLFPDDVSLSESDTELPTTIIDNTVSELEGTEPDAIIDVEQEDEDDEIVSQPDVETENIIAAELESTESEVSVDVEADKSHKESAEVQQPQDELSNIIASLETMLQDEPQSNEEQVVDGTNTSSPPYTDWVQPSGDQVPVEIPTEVLVDGTKDDVFKADLNQQPSDDVNQTITVTPKLDTETTDIKPITTAPKVDTETTDIKPITTAPKVDTETTDIKPITTAPKVDTETTDIKPTTTAPKVDTETTDIKPTTTAPKVDTETTDIKPITTAPKVDTETTDIKPITTAPKVDTETTDIKPITTAPKVDTPKATATLPVRSAPPPPPLPPIGKVKSPPKLVTSPTSCTTSPTKAKSPPPAVKPKPKRPISGSLAEEFQDELAEKLKRRQQKIHDWAKDDNPKPPPQTAPTIFTKKSSATQARTAAQNTTPVVPNLQATSVPFMQGAVSNTQHTTPPSGTQEQIEQYQSLQNQVLQQQILMLQQQLQQLQQQIPQGQVAGNPMMAMPQIMPQPGIGMQIPQVGTGMQMGGSGMQIPQAANVMQAPQFGTGMQVPMQQQNKIPLHNSAQTPTDVRASNATRTPKITTGLNASTDSESTCSESPPPPPPPATSPPPLDSSPYHDQVVRRNISKTRSDSALQQRPSSQLLRSRAFGEYEDALDDILEEVREVDHDAILKKPPPPPNQTGGPHIEMASLLAEAMKQRRINITSTRRLSSASGEEEPDTSHEWD